MTIIFDKLIQFKFDMVAAVAIGLIALYLGLYIKRKTTVFDKYGVPAAVIGGLIVSVLHLILRESGIGSLDFNTTLQTPFMVLFFTTIGLGSSVEALKKGGKLLVFFWLASGFMTFMQTVIGVSLAKLTGVNPLIGVIAGSVTMSGGHGSGAAFGKTIESLGVNGALSAAMASATFGLIAGSLLGAPLAFYLIKKYNLKPVNVLNKDEVGVKVKMEYRQITSTTMLAHATMLAIVMAIGMTLSGMLEKKFGIALPSYCGAMLVAIVFNNLNLKYKWLDMDRHLIDVLGEVSLSIFLSMALVSVKLWELYALALPLIIILFSQVLFMALYTRFVVFKLMGSDYDAAVIISGMCGSGLGATPNAMINMGEVSRKFGYTMNPYLVVPLTGAFLIDIFQMPVIITAINIFSK